jgi:DnaJ-class molecular chaperone
MRCKPCEGTGLIVRVNPYIAPDLFLNWFSFCLDCGGAGVGPPEDLPKQPDDAEPKKEDIER